MYICKDCGERFFKPNRTREAHSECDGNPAEVFYVCPNCGSGSFDKASECSICGELFTGDELDHDLCQSCRHRAAERFKQLLDKYFTGEEIAYLNDLYDGEYFGGVHNGTKT